MPIDILSHAKIWFNKFANKTMFGEIIGNPICMGLAISLILMIVMYFVNGTKPEFKTAFYVFITAAGLLIIHDNVLKERMKETTEDENIGQITPDSDFVSPIQPRPVEKLTRISGDANYYMSDAQQPQRLAMGAGYHGIQPGMPMSAFASTPTTADELMEFVAKT